MISKHEIDLINRRDYLISEKLFNQLHSKIFLYCLIVLKDDKDAEDVAQDVFLALWINHHVKFEKEQDIRNYLFILARNKCFDILKQNLLHKSKLRNMALNNNFEEPDFLSICQEAEIIDELHKAISLLTSEEAQVIIFTYWGNLNDLQTSQTLDISLRTLYRRKESATDKLREVLKDKYFLITALPALIIVCTVFLPKKTFEILAVFYDLIVFNTGL